MKECVGGILKYEGERTYGEQIPAACRQTHFEEGKPLGYTGLCLWGMAAILYGLYGWAVERLCHKGAKRRANHRERHAEIPWFHILDAGG